jgi:hypothetical protein
MTPKEQSSLLWLSAIVGGVFVGATVHARLYDFAAGLAVYFVLVGMSAMVKRQ